jgi:hypothetical protein
MTRLTAPATFSESPLAPSTLSWGRWKEGLNRFFFAEEVPYGMAIVRMIVPMSLMGNLIRRWPWVREVYSSDGAPSPLAENFGYMGFLPEIAAPLAVALFTLMMFALVSASIGLLTRTSLIIGAALYFYFSMMDSVSTITKYSVICTHLFLLLALSGCGKVWSVDAWLARRRTVRDPFAGTDALPRCAVWPTRLMQLFLGVVYIGAAFTKMHTPVFFSGDQLMYWMMTHVLSPSLLGDLFSQYPIVLSVFAYITIVWEVAFVFCVFSPMLRLPFLFVGAAFHFMTALTLGLLVFPAVMIGSYFAFVTESDCQWLSARGRRVGRWFGAWTRRRAVLCRSANWWFTGRANPVGTTRLAAMYAAGMALLMMTGVAIEDRRDLYGLRRPEGRYSLKPMDTALAQQMLAPEIPIAERDKVLALDAGTFTIGEHLVDRRRVFQTGEQVTVQASLNPPREDLWLDCHLVDENGSTISRVGQIAPREMMRSTFLFDMTPGLEPGKYAFLLKSSGVEVTRVPFTLVGKPADAAPAPVATLGN